MMAGDDVPNAKPTLLGLPPELRLLIYGFYTQLHGGRPISRIVKDDVTDRWVPQLFCFGSSSAEATLPALLLVNRQIHEEYRAEVTRQMLHVVHIGPDPTCIPIKLQDRPKKSSPCGRAIEFVLDVRISAATAQEISSRFKIMLRHMSSIIESCSSKDELLFRFICPPDASAALVDMNIYFAALRFFHHNFPERLMPVVIGQHIPTLYEETERRTVWCFACGGNEGLSWRLLCPHGVPSLVRRGRLGWTAVGLDGRAM